MRTIGLIGGMSWESSLHYYRIINETVRDCLGGLHSAECLMFSVDFHDVEVLQRENRWNEAGVMMAQAARRLERGGADCIVLCTNTMHKLADAIEASVAIPLLHIADLTADQARRSDSGVVGLLGTRFTMEDDFYRGRLEHRHGLQVLTPPKADRQMIHDVIYDELCRGIIRPESRQRYQQSINWLADQGAQAIILGCTEIGMLVQPEDAPVPLLDTTRIHAQGAVAWALS